MLDTNICIYIAKHKPASVLQHFKTLKVNQIIMSMHLSDTNTFLKEILHSFPGVRGTWKEKKQSAIDDNSSNIDYII